MESWQRIRHLHATGCSIRRIAAELGLSRVTVRKAIAAEAPARYQRTPGPSPWEPWHTQLETGLRLGLRGSRVLNELRAAGYAGSRSAFYAHWEQLRAAARESAATCRFETAPGEQAQFDWAEYVLSLGGLAQKVYLFALVLGYSRRVHWFPSLSSKQEALFEALEVGFQHFGGGCRFVVIDNPQSFLARGAGGEKRWNPNFLRFAGYYRFQPIACTPRNPQAKGKVENPFGNLEALFLRGRTWPDWDHFSQELATFEADWELRVHGTTKVPPLTRFQEELPRLLPLPPTPYLGWHEEFRSVSKDCLISYGGVRYSVPWAYAQKSVLVRPSQGRSLVVYAPSGTVLARHTLRPSGAPPVMVPAHYEGLRRRHRAALNGLARQFQEQYGPAEVADAFLQRLLAQHRHHPERALGQVLELLAAVPASVALAALATALEFNLCTPRFVEECLRRAGAATAAPTASAPGLPALQLTLPQLAVERPLADYGRALAPPPPTH